MKGFLKTKLAKVLMLVCIGVLLVGGDACGSEDINGQFIAIKNPTFQELKDFVHGQFIAIKNPTFQELKDFVLGDLTSRNEFVLNQYECRNFATEVNNNAEAEGLRCAFVLLCYDRGQHSVVAFDTTDRGLVYIEPQTDARIHPEVGGKYQEQEIIEILIAW